MYIVAATKFSWGTYVFWGYPMNLPAYGLACIAGAVIYYPLNKYVFGKKCNEIEITINGKKKKVKEGGIYNDV